MDTALALMDSQEPVYPLDIVRTMRDQRACMVQNVVSKMFLLHIYMIKCFKNLYIQLINELYFYFRRVSIDLFANASARRMLNCPVKVNQLPTMMTPKITTTVTTKRTVTTAIKVNTIALFEVLFLCTATSLIVECLGDI